jgi:hypothetical protein
MGVVMCLIYSPALPDTQVYSVLFRLLVPPSALPSLEIVCKFEHVDVAVNEHTPTDESMRMAQSRSLLPSLHTSGVHALNITWHAVQ